jgi:hypothetical protein
MKFPKQHVPSILPVMAGWSRHKHSHTTISLLERALKYTVLVFSTCLRHVRDHPQPAAPPPNRRANHTHIDPAPFMCTINQKLLQTTYKFNTPTSHHNFCTRAQVSLCISGFYTTYTISFINAFTFGQPLINNKKPRTCTVDGLSVRCPSYIKFVTLCFTRSFALASLMSEIKCNTQRSVHVF